MTGATLNICILHCALATIVTVEAAKLQPSHVSILSFVLSKSDKKCHMWICDRGIEVLTNGGSPIWWSRCRPSSFKFLFWGSRIGSNLKARARRRKNDRASRHRIGAEGGGCGEGFPYPNRGRSLGSQNGNKGVWSMSGGWDSSVAHGRASSTWYVDILQVQQPVSGSGTPTRGCSPWVHTASTAIHAHCYALFGIFKQLGLLTPCSTNHLPIHCKFSKCNSPSVNTAAPVCGVDRVCLSTR